MSGGLNGANVHVGLVGTGRIGALHARSLKQSPAVSRLTVVDADRERAMGVASALGAEHVDSAQTLLESGIDALAVAAATPGRADLHHMAADGSVRPVCDG